MKLTDRDLLFILGVPRCIRISRDNTGGVAWNEMFMSMSQNVWLASGLRLSTRSQRESCNLFLSLDGNGSTSPWIFWWGYREPSWSMMPSGWWWTGWRSLRTSYRFVRRILRRFYQNCTWSTSWGYTECHCLSRLIVILASMHGIGGVSRKPWEQIWILSPHFILRRMDNMKELFRFWRICFVLLFWNLVETRRNTYT